MWFNTSGGAGGGAGGAGPDPFGRAPSFLNWNARSHARITQEDRAWIAGLSDECGASPSLGAAAVAEAAFLPQEQQRALVAALSAYTLQTLAPRDAAAAAPPEAGAAAAEEAAPADCPEPVAPPGIGVGAPLVRATGRPCLEACAMSDSPSSLEESSSRVLLSWSMKRRSGVVSRRDLRSGETRPAK